MNGEGPAHGVLGGAYRLEKVLSRGGVGTLYRGTHIRTGRDVAVKVLSEPDSSWDLRHFEREARAAAALHHPNVVQVLDVNATADGTPFLVMELLRGESLDDVLRRRTTVSPSELLQWLMPVAGALHFMHGHGLVHRDVKPDNVFLVDTPRGPVPKLIDFGLALKQGDPRLTSSKTVSGTPLYMSPEQAQAGPVGPQSDVWSLGILAFRALAGVEPFMAESTTALLLKIVSGPIPSLADHAPHVHPAFAEAIGRALVRNTSGRCQDAAQFARLCVEAAILAGYSLPADPDPSGLPDYQDWVVQARGLSQTDELALASSEPAGRDGTQGVLTASETQGPQDRRERSADAVAPAPAPKRVLFVATVALLLAAAAVVVPQLQRSPTPELFPSPVVGEPSPSPGSSTVTEVDPEPSVPARPPSAGTLTETGDAGTLAGDVAQEARAPSQDQTEDAGSTVATHSQAASTRERPTSTKPRRPPGRTSRRDKARSAVPGQAPAAAPEIAPPLSVPNAPTTEDGPAASELEHGYF